MLTLMQRDQWELSLRRRGSPCHPNSGTKRRKWRSKLILRVPRLDFHAKGLQGKKIMSGFVVSRGWHDWVEYDIIGGLGLAAYERNGTT
jgi:hypothetical protein